MDAIITLFYQQYLTHEKKLRVPVNLVFSIYEKTYVKPAIGIGFSWYFPKTKPI
jgi:hypothetical protein